MLLIERRRLYDSFGVDDCEQLTEPPTIAANIDVARDSIKANAILTTLLSHDNVDKEMMKELKF